ncbi:ribonuclease inhibitor [Actinidia rufa]|uniref:Ribonuclease inhibitor n=1 Tax=Actinidia rufa TaxID=165716 RepID=A0A7J0EM70_9ERIC|nr:ribonuclease inhibitor [Actinidia rufa]
MALNISRNSLSSIHPLEGSLSSAIKFGNEYLMEGCPDKYSADFGNYMNFNLELENFQDCKREKTELLSDDIIDLLPSDPFGMDLNTSFTAITGWLEDIENDLGLTSLGFITDKVEAEAGEDGLLAGLNLVWNGAVKFHQDVNNSKIQESSIEYDKELWAGLCNGGLLLDGNKEDFMDFSYDKYWVSSNADNGFQKCTEIHSDGDGGAPHDALFFTFGYLGLRDLLSVERVCKSFRDAVQNDPLLWRSIHIDHPLSEKIADYALLQLTSRARGTLQCLSLVECFRITDSGLRNVLESNPGLTKASKSAGKLSIKHLRIGGLFGITNKQFEELKFLLGADNHRLPGASKPRFYREGQLYPSCDDDCTIDIEACPRCDKPREVYDCPAESCQGEHHSPQLCRACTLCIARCFHCGRCINGYDYEETFFLDLICLDCWKQLLSCQKEQDEMGRSSKRTAFHQQASYHFYLCG